MKVFFLITIDTECDKGPGWLLQRPMRFDSVTQGIPQILTPLFEEFRLKPTYLLSPEVLANADCVQTLKACSHAELGTHLHGEFIEPEADWAANRTHTPQMAYTPEVERRKLENLTTLFTTAFGYPPSSFRAGRWGMSTATLDILEQLGYLVDSSVCPFRTHSFGKGLEVNYWGAPLQPYRPSRRNLLLKGSHRILEAPATLGNPSLLHCPRFLLRRLSDRSRIHKKILGKMGRSAGITWLRPYKSTAAEMIALSEQYIQAFGKYGKPVFLNMMFHSNEIIPQASPYAQTEAELDAYLNSLRQLFEYLSSRYDLEGIGLSDVAKL
jgi:hypothetical protein